jgi:hypothetical protein
LARMVRANSLRILTAGTPPNDASYATRLVYTFRLFQLQPRSTENAELLLSRIPTTGDEWLTLRRLGDSLCDNETIAEMRMLSKVRDGFPRELANAVLESPRLLAQYVRYSMDDTLDPHSDSAIQMRKVCQKMHPDFIRALGSLPLDKQNWFATYVMNSKTCRIAARQW